jgi:membrane protein implicated in regulation of membrane protease activity
MTVTKIMVVMMMIIICVQIACVYNPTSTQNWVIMVGFVIISVVSLVVTSKALAVGDKET